MGGNFLTILKQYRFKDRNNQRNNAFITRNILGTKNINHSKIYLFNIKRDIFECNPLVLKNYSISRCLIFSQRPVFGYEDEY